MLNTPVKNMDAALRLEHVQSVIRLIETAHQHAFFASRSRKATDQEHDFLHFLQLIQQQVESAVSMTQQQSHLEGDESFLCQFLNTVPTECLIPALHYRRRAEDILEGLCNLLKLAQMPYLKLKRANVASLEPSELERYNKAYKSFDAELNRSLAQRAPVPEITRVAG